MPIQSAAGVVLSFRREATPGTIAANDSTARHVPYVSHGLALSKSTIASEEIRPDFQDATMRHGSRQVAGPLELQLQCGTYGPLMEAALRRDFTAFTALAALTNVTAASVGSGGTFTRAAGSWITDGLYVGMTIRMSGWTTTAVANNARNYTIIALTATVITVAEPVVAKTAGDSVVVSLPGRITFVPASGHTNAAFTFEEWSPDVPRSFRFLGTRINTMGVNLQPNARASLNFGLMGRDRASNASRYFSSGVAAAPSIMQVGHQGQLVVNGAASAIITSCEINVTNNMEAGQVIGQATPADIFYGRIQVTGRLSCYFDTAVFDDVFDQESEIGLFVRANDDTGVGGNFLSFAMTRIKLSGGSYSTQSASRVQQFDFTSLVNPAAGTQPTTLIVQDSTLP